MLGFVLGLVRYYGKFRVRIVVSAIHRTDTSSPAMANVRYSRAGLNPNPSSTSGEDSKCAIICRCIIFLRQSRITLLLVVL